MGAIVGWLYCVTVLTFQPSSLIFLDRRLLLVSLSIAVIDFGGFSVLAAPYASESLSPLNTLR